jgi:pyruvate,orthophosphate dikinase
MGENSATGVAFTRNPSSGAKVLYGEFLTNAQGEDVVAGLRNTTPIAQMGATFPAAAKRFHECCDILEKHFKNMQGMACSLPL